MAPAPADSPRSCTDERADGGVWHASRDGAPPLGACTMTALLTAGQVGWFLSATLASRVPVLH